MLVMTSLILSRIGPQQSYWSILACPLSNIPHIRTETMQADWIVSQPVSLAMLKPRVGLASAKFSNAI
jgi:hypothetical protein